MWLEDSMKEQMRKHGRCEVTLYIISECYPADREPHPIEIFAFTNHDRETGRSTPTLQGRKTSCEKFENFVLSQGWQFYPDPVRNTIVVYNHGGR